MLVAVLLPAALLLPTVPRVAPASRASLVRMQFDEEGGMVKEIEEGGMTLEQVRASYGAEAPKLDDAKAALLVLKEPEWNVNKMAVSATDEDFVLECSSMGDSEVVIEVEPFMNTIEEYCFGFTADSDPKFSIVHEESSPIEGRMQRRGGEPEVVKVKFDPNGASGEFVAHLCFILPEENMYSKFYSITAKSS